MTFDDLKDANSCETILFNAYGTKYYFIGFNKDKSILVLGLSDVDDVVFITENNIKDWRIKKEQKTATAFAYWFIRPLKRLLVTPIILTMAQLDHLIYASIWIITGELESDSWIYRQAIRLRDWAME